MKENKGVFELLTEYASQENTEKTNSEQEYIAYKTLGATTQGECCCTSLCALCCCGL